MHATVHFTTRFSFRSGFLFVTVLVAGLAGCKKPADPTPPAANPASPTGSITPAQRTVVLAACEQKFATVADKPFAEMQQEMSVWLKARPDFVATGVDQPTQTVWAIFADGRFLMIANNRPPVAFEDRGGRVAAEPLGGRPGELPNDKKVLLMNGMGTHFINSPAGIAPIFGVSKTSYSVSQQRATVDNLKAVGEEVAGFYLSTHGGKVSRRDSLRINGRPVPLEIAGLWTVDTRSEAGDTKYQKELDDWQLGYMIAKNDEPTKGVVTKETHYAITAKFVTDFMKFGENALIYVDACSSYQPGAPGEEFAGTFINRAKNQKATYLGWTAPVRDAAAYRAAKFVFDRLLGANSSSINPTLGIPKETPDQRPFDLDAVMKDLSAKNLSTSTSPSGVTATLRHISTIGPDNRPLLAPSVSFLEIDELTSELTVHGLFGTDPGEANREVTVNGKKVLVNVNGWQPEEISCIIPAKGDGAAGPVVVSARGQQSNAVPLTEWYIPFTWREVGGNFTREAVITLHLRADVHRYRRTPGEKSPKRSDQSDPIPVHPFGKGSKTTFRASGSCSYVCPCNPGTFSVTHSLVGPPEVNLPYAVDGSSATNNFFAIYGWDRDRNVLSLFASGSDFESYKEREVSGDCDGKSRTTNTPLPFAFVITESLSQVVLELPMANPDGFDFRFKKGERKFGTIALEFCQCGGSPEVPVTLRWDDATPRFAPDDKTAGRVAADR